MTTKLQRYYTHGGLRTTSDAAHLNTVCLDAHVSALEDALSECEAEKAAWEAKEKALRELAKQCNLKAAAIFEQYGEWHGEEDAIIMGRDEAADEMLAILNREQEKQQ